MSNFSFAIGQKFTTNNYLILEVIDKTTFVFGIRHYSEPVTIYVSKAVGRTLGSETDPTRPLPANLFFHRADGVRLKQQGEDGETNINAAYVELPQTPTLTGLSPRAVVVDDIGSDALYRAEVGDRVVTANGLVLEVTAIGRDASNALVFSSRAVGRSNDSNSVNFGTPLPRNVFQHNRYGSRIGDYSSATNVERAADPHETARDFRPLTADEVPAARVLGDGLSA